MAPRTLAISCHRQSRGARQTHIRYGFKTPHRSPLSGGGDARCRTHRRINVACRPRPLGISACKVKLGSWNPGGGPRFQEQAVALPTDPKQLQRHRGGGRIERRVRGLHIRHIVSETPCKCFADWECAHTQLSVRKPTCTNTFTLGIRQRRHERVRTSRSESFTEAAPTILPAAGAAVSATGYAARWRGERRSRVSRPPNLVL